MSDAADVELLALLAGDPALRVHDGSVDADETTKVISVPLPYVVFFSADDDESDERFSGNVAAGEVQFQVNYVGDSREQAKRAGKRARACLSRKRITVNGKRSGLIHLDDSMIVRRDDVFTRPGGGPLFYGVDLYSVGNI